MEKSHLKIIGIVSSILTMKKMMLRQSSNTSDWSILTNWDLKIEEGQTIVIQNTGIKNESCFTLSLIAAVNEESKMLEQKSNWESVKN